jgi:hypothetical protein
VSRDNYVPTGPVVMKPRVCVECGAGFESARATRKYCSSSCSEAVKRRRNRDAMKERARQYHLKTRYGMTEQDFEDLLASQDYSCAVCRSTEPAGRWRGWHVDHDHDTGEVRGILCTSCNWVLGYAKDDPEVLVAAAAYLITHKEKA